MRRRRQGGRIGSGRGKRLGFAVRVPSTVAGARTIGLDVAAWIQEGLVDIVVPSCFFCTDLAVDMTEWVEMARDTPASVRDKLAVEHSSHEEICIAAALCRRRLTDI